MLVIRQINIKMSSHTGNTLIDLTNDSDDDSTLSYHPFTASTTSGSPTSVFLSPQPFRSLISDDASVEIAMVVTPGVKRPNSAVRIPTNIAISKKKKNEEKKKKTDKKLNRLRFPTNNVYVPNAGVNQEICFFLRQLAYGVAGEAPGRRNNLLSAANQLAQLSDPVKHKVVKGKKVLVYLHKNKLYDKLLYIGESTSEKILEFLNIGRNHCLCEAVDEY